MRKLLNNLYITSPNSYIKKDGENLLILLEDEKKFRIPIHTIENIICFGYQGASPSAMNFCAENGVGLAFHNEYGKFLARVNGPIKGNVLLRKKQYELFDGSKTKNSKIANNLIKAKISNKITILARAVRDHKNTINTEKIESVIKELKKIKLEIDLIENIDSLRGIEGHAARIYFSVLDELILSQKNDFFMFSRNKRPPTDNFNALLSFLYTMLANNVQSALESVGLDPYVGFMHQIRPGRPSLALDLMEELRPIIADRLAVSLINRNQLCKKGFIKKENEAVLLEKKARKTVLECLHKKNQTEFIHPFLNEKFEIGLIPYAQSLLLARYIRGDINEYPPLIWK